MSIPVPTFTSAGLSVPSEKAIKAGVWAMFQDAFGGALNESDATPQGQLVTSITAAMGASNDLLLQFTNLVDPALSSGRMQDAIGRIYYMERIGATATAVECTCTGIAGTILPPGSLAQATDGVLYYSTGQATIGEDGNATVQFVAIEAGPLQCPAGALSKIYRVIPGWDSITNASDGVPGRNEETPAQFETRRRNSVALNATGIVPAIHAAVLDVDGVLDAYVTENSTESSVTIGGVSVARHSIYVAAQGGTDADIAAAIFSRKPPGCGMVGTTTVAVQDRTGYSTPYPSYNIKFQRPTAKPIYFAVVLADNGQVPADAAVQVQSAIVAAFAGADGGQPAKIGATVYALRFASAVAALGSWAQLISINIGTTSTPTSAEVAVNANEFPTITAGHIAVTLA
jgi:uncharacterized phage protein gp47/JayE